MSLSMAEMIHRESDARRKKICRRAAELASAYLRECAEHKVELTDFCQDAIWNAALAMGQVEHSYGPRHDFTVVPGGLG